MVLYAIYRNSKPVKDQKLQPEHKDDIIINDIENANAIIGQEVIPKPVVDIETGEKKEDQKQVDQRAEKKEQDQLVANARNQTEHNNNNNSKKREAGIQLQQQREG